MATKYLPIFRSIDLFSTKDKEILTQGGRITVDFKHEGVFDGKQVSILKYGNCFTYYVIFGLASITIGVEVTDILQPLLDQVGKRKNGELYVNMTSELQRKLPTYCYVLNNVSNGHMGDCHHFAEWSGQTLLQKRCLADDINEDDYKGLSGDELTNAILDNLADGCANYAIKIIKEINQAGMLNGTKWEIVKEVFRMINMIVD